MQKFDKFYFEKYSFNRETLVASFRYSFDKKEFFEEEIDFFSDDFEYRNDLNFKVIENLLFHLHIALGISYYKLYPTKQLVIESGFLTKKQIFFWQKFYKNGLGEFLVKNNIKANGLFNFSSVKVKETIYFADILEKNNGSLLMWGGGKDSIVSSIILDDQNRKFTPFIFGKIDKIKSQTLRVLGKKPMLVKRKLSDNLFSLNNKGYYNGHVPITGIIAFVSLVSAYIYNFKDIILSNEKSASEENLVWQGLKINHQYSKSLDFEKDFSEYLADNISKDINYYSLLRDKYEYEIASIFAQKAGKYFDSFSSCNKNFKINGEKQDKNWCCNCEKCAFVYLILSSFLDEDKMISIFSENLFANKDLLITYKELLGFGKNKPFECVGTYKESFLSAFKTLKNYKNKIISGEIKKLPYILEKLESEIIKKSQTLDLLKIERELLLHEKK